MAPVRRASPVADAADLRELCATAIGAAQDGEEVEAFAEESRRVQVRARGGDVESLTFAESRGVGVRLVRDGRLGYVFAADPSPTEVAEAVRRARENAALGSPDEHNGLPARGTIEGLDGLFDPSMADLTTERKVALALDLEAVAVRTDPRVRKVEQATYADAISRTSIASTAGLGDEYSRTDCWCAVSALAEDGDETQTGSSLRIARNLDDLDWLGCGAEAVTRAARLLGATKPRTARVPVVLDQGVVAAFLGVLAGALSAESVQKGRSLFATLVGEEVGARAVNLIDDGRLLAGPGAAPFDDEGVATRETPLIDRGRLSGFLHNTYTARRGGKLSTGNAGRGGYRTPPGVAPSNLFLRPGDRDLEALVGLAGDGVYIQEVAGVHSGANPVSGEFSVGATGLRITGGGLAEPLREMTVASTLTDVLSGVSAVGSDLRFLGSIGAPSILVETMTVAGT